MKQQSDNLSFFTKEVRQHSAWELIGHTRPNGWHGQDAVTEAFVDAHLNYELVAGVPSLTLPDGSTMPYSRTVNNDKNVAIVRPAVPGLDANPRALGMVSRKYFEESLIQPMTLARIANPLAIRWNVVAVGALNGGAKTFIALELGERSIEIFGPKGGSALDGFKGFLFITEDHRGGGSVKFFHGLMRWFCKNQFLSLVGTLAGNQSSRTTGLLSIPHHGMAAELLELRAKVEVAEENARQREEARLKAMAAFALTEPQIDYVLSQAYPDASQHTIAKLYDHIMPQINADVLPANDPTLVKVQAEREEADRDTGKKQQRVENKRDDVRAGFALENELNPQWAGSAYNLFNSITAMEDHGGNRSAGVRQSVLMGERAKAKIAATVAISEVIGFNG